MAPSNVNFCRKTRTVHRWAGAFELRFLSSLRSANDGVFFIALPAPLRAPGTFRELAGNRCSTGGLLWEAVAGLPSSSTVNVGAAGSRSAEAAAAASIEVAAAVTAEGKPGMGTGVV
jgi:hypothetical protein